MIWKTIVGDELYVRWNGHLIYKRWLTEGHDKVFDLHGSFPCSVRPFKDWLCHYRDNDGGVYIRRWAGHGPVRTVVYLVMPSLVVSQEFA